MREELPVGLAHPALAACLESRRGEILAAYEDRLEQSASQLRYDEAALSQLLAHAEEIIDEVAESLRSGHEVSGEGSRLLPRHIGAARGSAGVHPAEMIRSAAELFKILTSAAVDCAVDCAADAAGSPLAFAVLAVNQSMSLRIREAITSYYGFLLHRLHQAQADERRRLARELHDRVNASIHIAHRRLELYEMSHGEDTAAADQHVEAARAALVQAMHDIRQLTADLRLSDPFQGLEKNLIRHLESAGVAGLATEVIVNGDESWLAPDVRDEVFLIIREAVRNALQHGHAQAIRIRVDIAPHELRASIDDDGAGFDPNRAAADAAGTGIASMNERAELLGGSIRLSSLVGKGTNVELHIPLPEVHENHETTAT
jgi:signal transduction histidine kinase